MLDFDVDAARSDVYAHVNTATALRHAIQHAADQIDRVGITLSKLDVERDDLRRESETLEADRAQAAGQAAQTREALARVADARRALEVELTTMRGDYDGRVRAIRAREQEAAAAEARLASLQELASNHADFGDAARAVLAQADASVSPRGAVADYLDVDRRYERAVEACLGDLLQYILVDGHEQAAAGLSLVRAGAAGRCGFVVAGGAVADASAPVWSHVPGVVAVTDAVRISGPYAAALRSVLAESYVAETFEQAVAFARVSDAPVATLEGDVLRGAHLVSGGARVEARGILATRREIKELGERTQAERELLARAADEVARLEGSIAAAAGLLAGLQGEQHEHEKALVGVEAQLARTADEAARQARKADVIALERRRAEEEREAADQRRTEAEENTVPSPAGAAGSGGAVGGGAAASRRRARGGVGAGRGPGRGQRGERRARGARGGAWRGGGAARRERPRARAARRHAPQPTSPARARAARRCSRPSRKAPEPSTPTFRPWPRCATTWCGPTTSPPRGAAAWTPRTARFAAPGRCSRPSAPRPANSTWPAQRRKAI